MGSGPAAVSAPGAPRPPSLPSSCRNSRTSGGSSMPSSSSLPAACCGGCACGATPAHQHFSPCQILEDTTPCEEDLVTDQRQGRSLHLPCCSKLPTPTSNACKQLGFVHMGFSLAKILVPASLRFSYRCWYLGLLVTTRPGMPMCTGEGSCGRGFGGL